MKTIQVLGTGCDKCRKLAANAEAAVRVSGATCEIVKVTDLGAIMRFGVMSTPALAIDGVVKAAGRVPSPEEIRGWLA
jgi:small redox-active disulfide protein 2